MGRGCCTSFDNGDELFSLTFIDDPARAVQWVRPHPRVGVPKGELVYGVAAVEFLGVVHIVQMDVPPVAHDPFPRGHVEISRDLKEVATPTATSGWVISVNA